MEVNDAEPMVDSILQWPWQRVVAWIGMVAVAVWVVREVVVVGLVAGFMGGVRAGMEEWKLRGVKRGLKTGFMEMLAGMGTRVLVVGGGVGAGAVLGMALVEPAGVEVGFLVGVMMVVVTAVVLWWWG
ncbi:hypothetical protein Pmani_007376 [Petrolisthes manimaculis]|uniref:Uncharacterized protein n=1 Tax=Petrolisthes manimaculis TaxID=1843537 RepID=A0AAE1Q8I5_9EUCA|nr:hypothetical protein Pmani_007376 [Petrolisthes manimaculis]